MNTNHFSVLTAATAAALLGLGCQGAPDADPAKEANKKAFEAASTELKKPAGLIAAFLPYLDPPDMSDKYTPRRSNDREKASAYAADEIRHAANSARQTLQRSETEATKPLVAALGATSAACADTKDQAAFDKCKASVKALSEAIEKTEAASGAAGSPVKLPRFTPDAVTDDAKKSLATFLKARGPGAAEKTYIEKRADPKIAVSELISACQAAVDEADATARVYEKGEEPLQVISALHKMSVESQCGNLNAADASRKDLETCKKKPKTPECPTICGKAKAIIEKGIPAAAVAPLEAEYTEICDKK